MLRAAADGDLQELQKYDDILTSKSAANCLTKACAYGHLHIAQYLHSRFDLKCSGIRRRFWDACREGHLHVAQWLHNTFGCEARSGQNMPLALACERGHLHVAKWLRDTFALTKNDATADSNYALRWACSKGHLTVAQWLHTAFELSFDDVSEDLVDIMQCAASGQLRVLRWLHAIFHLTSSDVTAYSNIYHTCANGHLATAQWLHKTFELSVDDFTFGLPTTDTHVMQWLRVAFGLGQPDGWQDLEYDTRWCRRAHRSWYWQAEVIVVANAVSATLLTDILRRTWS